MATLQASLEGAWESFKAYALIGTDWINLYWSWTVLVLAVLLISLRLLPWAVRQSYERWAAHKRVYIQVTMPREESTKDKENATEKDFKERIGIMEQLYRALHEIRELNLANQIMVWLFKRDTISMEIYAKHKDITFFLSVHPYYSEIVEKQITSFYPNASIDYIKPEGLQPKEVKRRNTVKGFYLYLKRLNWYPIKSYKTIENDPLNDFTNVLSKLGENDRATIQIMIQPCHEKWQTEARAFASAMFKNQKPEKKGILRSIFGIFGWFFRATVYGYDSAEKNKLPPGAQSGDSYVRMLQTDEEVAKRIGEKSNQVGFNTVIRVMASSDKGEAECDNILNGLFVAFNATKDAASNWFQARRLIPIDFINSPIMNGSMETRAFQFGEKMSVLTPEELASVFHLPSSRYNYTPIIKWLSYKVLPAPTDLPSDGILLGHNVYRGVKREVRFRRNDRTRHHYIIGQTGTGKSAFISSMARQDIINGDGVCVVDPHGDLIEEILQFVPPHRAKDVIIFDPSDTERPMGLNMLEAKTPEQQDMASSQATEIFIKIFGDEIFGPRIQHYFRNACLTLMEDPDEGATLIDVPRIFVDDEFMRYKVSKVKNPVVKSFWTHEYANTGDRERQEMIPYFSAKFGPFITNSIMRNTIGQAKSGFNIREIMDNQKILLVNLSKGKLGGLNTQLLGLVLVAQIQQAAMSRVDIPEADRKDFYLYVDEFQNFATDTFCSILSEARKYKLCLIMAHQYIGQLTVTKMGSTSSQIRDAVFGNVGTLQSFKIGAEDAEYLAKEYAPVLTEQDVIGIANYKAYIKLNVNNATSRPFSLETIWDMSKANPALRNKVKEYSRLKYGRKKLFVEQEITSRIGIDMNSLGADVKPDYTADVNSAAMPPAAPPSPLPPKDNGTA